MIVRCTARVAQALKLGRLPDTPQTGDDWYVNTVTIGRRRVVLAVHTDTLFPIVAAGVSAAQLRALPTWLADQAVQALADEGLPATRFGSLDTAHALLVRTASKKGLEQLNQLAADVEWAVHRDGWDRLDLVELNRSLRRSLRGRDGGYVVPLELAEQRQVDPSKDALLAQFQTQIHGASADELLQLEASIEHADPPIIRTLELPATSTLEQLHHLLQRSFGWEDRHLYRFARGSDIWGRKGTELYLCDFDIAEAEYNDQPAKALPETRVGALLADVGHQLLYLYDYGDHWQLTLTLTGRGQGAADRATITGGQGLAPPDDMVPRVKGRRSRSRSNAQRP